MKKYFSLIPVTVAFLLGGLLVFVVMTTTAQKTTQNDSRQVREGHGVYTNPLLECDIGADTIAAPKIRFERQFKDEIAKVDGRAGITEVAAYYRDLNNGPAFGVNQNQPFFPASLLKVPLMMAFFKHAESDPAFLTKEIIFKQSDAPELAVQNVLPEKQLTNGKKYSVDELMLRMIAYSDNNAMEVLYPLLPEKEYQDLYQNLGIDHIDPSNAGTSLSVVEYSTFFRVLFNASYLSQTSSERALKILTQSTFASGLRAGVPSQIEIAHKFGERDLGDGFYQLHDCGIIYVPNSPYLLCVMTRGTNRAALEDAIRDISKFTYGQVQKQ